MGGGSIAPYKIEELSIDPRNAGGINSRSLNLDTIVKLASFAS